MKGKIRKSRKKTAVISVLGLAAGISILMTMSQKPVEESVREREYTATRDTITVGVESGGLINASPNAHSFEAGTMVEKLLVKVGSQVKKGEPLASISTENLKKLIETAQDELSDAKAALLQASSDRQVLIARNQKDKEDGFHGVQQEYESQTELLTSEKERMEASVAEQEAKLILLQQQIRDGSAQIESLKEQIACLNTKINENILEIGRLNEELLKAGYGSEKEDALGNQIGDFQEEMEFFSDALEEQNAIQLEITKLQNENTAMQQEIDGYKADPVFTDLEQLKEEQKACQDLLDSNYETLSLKLEEIRCIEKKFQQAMEKQKNNNAFSDYKTSEELKSINENIAKADRNVQAAQKKVTRLQALSQNPTIYAQLDGVVTALNYKVGDTVVEGKPLCIVGKLDAVTMTVPVNASDIGSVAAGQKVNIYVDAYAEQKFTGTVKEKLLVANDNGEYPVTISIDPGEQILLPGMKAYATIILKEKEDVLTLSNKAITLENGQQYVSVRNEKGELVQKRIITGFSDGRVSEILDGLSENEVVIVQE